MGLSPTELRWLAYQGYVDHAAQYRKGRVRTFRPEPTVRLTRRTCVILTDTGAAYARRLGCRETRLHSSTSHSRAGRPAHYLTPRWDPARRRLSLGRLLVKQFRQPALNQELILAALEEEHWPPHLDDPLPPMKGIDSKRRLHDTIRRLNRNQEHRLLRFHGDGTGHGVLWEAIVPSAHRAPTERP
jgi:hypothetical protein